MMGKRHARSAAAVWVGGCALATWRGVHVHPGLVAAGGGLAYFGGYIPDIDHPQASINTKWVTRIDRRWVPRFVPRWVARIVRSKVPGPAVWGLPVRAAYFLVRWAVFVAAWLAFAFRGPVVSWRRAHRLDDHWFGHRRITHSAFFAVLVGGVFGGLALLIPATRWLPGAGAAPAVALSVGVGVLAHTLGDMLTNDGCPIAAPLSWRRYSARLFRTDGWGERVVVARIVDGALIAGLAVYGWLVLLGDPTLHTPF